MSENEKNEKSESEAAASTPISPAKALYKEGFGFFVKGELENAIAKYGDAIAADETLAIAWNGLSIALAKKGDIDAAIEAAEKLVELDPKDALSHTNLSRIQMQGGRIQDAEDSIARATHLQMKSE